MVPTLFSGNAARADQSFRYCGKLLWPAQREDYLPFPVGIEAVSSTEPHLAQAIRKAQKYEIRISFEDMHSSYRFLQQAVNLLITQGKNHACVLGSTVEASEKGLPIEISVSSTKNGKLVTGDFPAKKTK